jgi:hypothetical protein
VPERAALRIEQENRATGTGDLFLGKVAECLQDVAKRAAGGDHLQDAALPLVRPLSYPAVRDCPEVSC